MLLDWRDSVHFRWDAPCVLCKRPIPLCSHAGKPVHKVCAENWCASNLVVARLGRSVSDAKPKHDEGHA
ncbi:hypothetical protein [Streptomyces sp. Wb2n-11]|uniref:hypothetical protein n=1 Tax=Streptomyces sp. Wb2n-11 TaxID=1030533 RepID=UPI000A97E6B4|nr:hypothetical protein [Streptomyces sp. Wb2n-11]